MKDKNKPQLKLDFSSQSKEGDKNLFPSPKPVAEGKQIFLNTRDHIYAKILNRKME